MRNMSTNLAPLLRVHFNDFYYVGKLSILFLVVGGVVVFLASFFYLPGLLIPHLPKLASFLEVPSSWNPDYTFNNASLGFFTFFGFLASVIAIGFDAAAVTLMVKWERP